MRDPAGIIEQGCQILGIKLAPGVTSKMVRHLGMLLEWGRKINLSALKQPEQIAILHFLDSLTVFKVLPKELALNILDVGTGAGFPGLVLKTAEETFQLTLLDRDPKKIVFLKYVAKMLDLHGICFLNTPFKNLVINPEPSRFDVLISRAFSSNAELLDSLHAVVRPRGLLVRMAGPASLKEDFNLKHFHYVKHWEGTLPFSSHFRIITLYRKIDYCS